MAKRRPYFKIFSNCIPVKGITKSAIFDLSRELYIEIPNLLYDILITSELEKFSVADLKAHYKGQYSEGIDRYFQFLIDKQLAFFTDLPNCFPSMNMVWETPFHITNAIIEYTSEENFNLQSCLNQLEDLGCQAVELRFNSNFSIKDILTSLEHLMYSKIKLIIICANYYKGILDDIKRYRLLESNYRISKIIICSTPKENVNAKPQLIFSQKSMNALEVAQVNRNFVLNIKTFSEAINFNLFLNRKVAICKNGDIKNYLTHSKVFGNVNRKSLKEIIGQKDFKSVWSINNDRIEICKNCQFRYVCFDDSEVILKNGKYFKSKKCTFDPFTNKWSS